MSRVAVGEYVVLNKQIHRSVYDDISVSVFVITTGLPFMSFNHGVCA